jgi:hypothetical protein
MDPRDIVRVSSFPAWEFWAKLIPPIKKRTGAMLRIIENLFISGLPI